VVIVVMGVAGSGKTSVGEALALRLGYRFEDADAFHSRESVAKMRAGIPLGDADRAPWLASIAAAIDGWLASGDDVVLACSALAARHRRVLCKDPARMRLVYLRASFEVLLTRLEARPDHFMPASLLASQLATLEEPKRAIVVDAAAPLDLVVQRALDGICRWT
jgi:gluconokinase